MPILTEIVDLSVPFYEGMPCDDLGPKFWERTSYAYSRHIFDGTQSRAGRVFFTTDHTGTHVDGPLRFDRRERRSSRCRSIGSFARPASWTYGPGPATVTSARLNSPPLAWTASCRATLWCCGPGTIYS